MRRKLKFENYKNYLEATQLGNKIKYPEKKFGIDSIKKNYKQFVKNKKSILNSRQIFKSERHNVFNEEINKIYLSSSDEKRFQ